MMFKRCFDPCLINRGQNTFESSVSFLTYTTPTSPSTVKTYHELQKLLFKAYVYFIYTYFHHFSEFWTQIGYLLETKELYISLRNTYSLPCFN